MQQNAVASAVWYLLLYNLLFIGRGSRNRGVVIGYQTRRLCAVMKRNFVGYFSNPTYYVFLCIFVFLTSLAAFWPYEFFNQNLATLDQLNYCTLDHAGVYPSHHDEHLG